MMLVREIYCGEVEIVEYCVTERIGSISGEREKGGEGKKGVRMWIVQAVRFESVEGR